MDKAMGILKGFQGQRLGLAILLFGQFAVTAPEVKAGLLIPGDWMAIGGLVYMLCATLRDMASPGEKTGATGTPTD